MAAAEAASSRSSTPSSVLEVVAVDADLGLADGVREGADLSGEQGSAESATRVQVAHAVALVRERAAVRAHQLRPSAALALIVPGGDPIDGIQQEGAHLALRLADADDLPLVITCPAALIDDASM